MQLDLTDEGSIQTPAHLRSDLRVLATGLRESPRLMRSIAATGFMSIFASAGYLMVPLLVQQVLDHGFEGGSLRTGFVLTRCGAGLGIAMLAYLVGRLSMRRAVRASEQALADLRVRGFDHIHRLSLATQSNERRGVFVARVTADVESLSRFTEWGAIAWIITFAVILGSGVLMFAFSWRMALTVVALLIPLLLVVSRLQKRVSRAYDELRGKVGSMLSEVSESVMGAAVIRAYGLGERVDERVKRAVRRRYDAQLVTHRRMATLWPMGTLFWGISNATVIAVAAFFGPRWGLSFGQAAAFLFLADMFVQSFTELPEIYGETQSAISGWRKILSLLSIPVEIVEPDPGVTLPEGTALAIATDAVSYRYGEGELVLHDVSLAVAAGAHVVIVGETGSGKSTFVKLLSRMADPTSGRITIADVDLREVARASRQHLVRMVPQDGFLFDTSIRENVRAGREGASDREVAAAFDELGLADWLATLPDGLDTRVGERGESLSAGERQLVSLARAQIGNPGVLILDEATSAVDPETERRIGEALRRLSAGRTTITIAHRLSTAEGADRVFVFDQGRLIESGTHAELVAAGGRYAGLYASWLGNVRGFV